MNHLDASNKMAAGDISESPADKILDFHVTEFEEGKVMIEIDTSEWLHNPLGTLHGGIFCEIANTVMGYAFATILAEDEHFSTEEIKLNFIKPFFKGNLHAEGKIVKKEASIGLLECQIYDEKQRIVAYATSTCVVLKGNPNRKILQLK